MTLTTPALRGIDRVHGTLRLGPDAQTDDKQLVLPPGDWRALDPFLFMAEDWFSARGFDWHPHRGIETVTVVLDGALEHGDNRGSAGVLEPGDVQWMTAGSGIIHRELAFKNEHAHTLQLWLNLPRSHKMVSARYQDLRATERPSVRAPGVTVSVISGRAGDIAGKVDTHWPITGMLISLEPGSSYVLPLPAHDRSFSYVLAGRVVIGGRELPKGLVGWSDPVPGGDSALTFAAPADSDEVARVLVFSGKPIGEPVVAAGPFVMCSSEEIRQAWHDFQLGRFGDIPRMARLKYRAYEGA